MPLVLDPVRPGITVPLGGNSLGFYTGLISASSIARSGTVASLADHWYPLDLASDRFRLASIPALRPQQDSSEQVGEQSLSVDGLWRRVVSGWEHGAGQTRLDRKGSNTLRFRASRGIDPWAEGQISMLPDTERIAIEAGGWTSLAVGEFTGGQRLVAAGANAKAITVDLAGAQTNISGLTGVLYVASNGSAAYLAAADGIYAIDASGTGVSLFNTNVNGATRLGFAKNRLIATVGQQLWDVIDGTTSSAHFTVPWTGWTWTGITEGHAAVFACGYAGDQGLVYSIRLKEDGTGLEAPLVALPLPHGEIPYAISGYLGFVVIGTSKGVRLATEDAEGHLTMGAVVGGDEHTGHTHPTRCLEPQEEFVWFGWDDAFVDAGGLGRVDLTRFVEPLAPAYATDLMAKETGATTAVITFDNKRFFTTGTGLYEQQDSAVAEAELETGLITFDLTDAKVAVYADTRHLALGEGERVELQTRTVDTDTYVVVGANENVGSTRPGAPYQMNHNRAIGHELKILLGKGSGDTGPVLTDVILAAQIAPQRSFNIFLPVLLHTTVNVNGRDYPMNPAAELAFLRQLAVTQQLVRYVQGSMSHLVFLEDFEWVPHHSTSPDESGFNGTCVLKLKSAEI